MKTRILFLAAAAALAVAPGCKKKEEGNADKAKPAANKDKSKDKAAADKAAADKATADKAAADKAAADKAAADKAAPGEGEVTMAAVVQMKVKSYDAWKTTFDKHADKRKAAGMLGHHINQGADDPNLVTLYMPISDADKFKAFSASDELKKMMAEAGVEGPPTIWIVNTTITKAVLDKPLPAIIVSHEVEDFGKWRKAYEAFDEERQKLGIVGHAVNQSVDNPNMVVVYHQAETLDALKKFVVNPRLAEVMKAAGVKGKPEISFHNAAGAAVMY